jgi:DnaK suppressor protein
MLTDQERSQVEQRLLHERERALDALREFDRTRETSLLEGTGELTMYRLHAADLGTEAMEQEKQYLLASVEGRRLYEIDEALRRLYASPDTFGSCARCGRPIGMGRLDVVPSTEHCAQCQIAVEGGAEPV